MLQTLSYRLLVVQFGEAARIRACLSGMPEPAQGVTRFSGCGEATGSG
jgi:hypothetical protein